jgi:hypothetical protein
MRRLVALVRTDVSENLIAFIITVNRNVMLGTALAVISIVPSSLIVLTMMMEAIHSSEPSVLTRTTRRHIPKDDILHNHRREILKSYIALTGWTV